MRNVREVYLDYAAATPMAAEVVESMTPYYSERFYNPSAPYARAREVRAEMEQARSRMAHVLGARPDNVTITAGATEANNLALAAVGGEVVCDAIEHESVLACVKARGGSVVAVDSTGRVSPEGVARVLTPKTELVSVEMANGEIGTLQPIREISRLLANERMRRLRMGERRPLLLHTDASQATGYVSVNVSSLGVDLMTISAAKIYGPKQLGLLWHADGVALRPLVLGGGQEGGLRSGTENVAGVMGFATALELAEGMRAQEVRRLQALSSRMRSILSQGLDDTVFSGPKSSRGRLPGLVHVSFPGLDARRLVIALERRGVYVGTGSACAASRMRVSHVLSALGVGQDVARGSLRISMGRPTTEEDVDYAAASIVDCVREERQRLRARRD